MASDIYIATYMLGSYQFTERVTDSLDVMTAALEYDTLCRFKGHSAIAERTDLDDDSTWCIKYTVHALDADGLVIGRTDYNVERKVVFSNKEFTTPNNWQAFFARCAERVIKEYANAQA